MNSQPTPTVLTLGHRRLHDRLNRIGLICEDEVRVGKYMLDIYVRDYHIAFEYDGPSHRGYRASLKDAERDGWLLVTAGIAVYRITDSDMRESFFERFIQDLVIVSCADLHMRLPKREKWPL